LLLLGGKLVHFSRLHVVLVLELSIGIGDHHLHKQVLVTTHTAVRHTHLVLHLGPLPLIHVNSLSVHLGHLHIVILIANLPFILLEVLSSVLMNKQALIAIFARTS
jgi:hypothetical protein